ncbi:metallo-beta-lactamase class B [Lewinella marina]|uniref:beta-lactamase n=1 Tax=Neolewinella marina TaxID=438751 RepID=A0A2G0CK08_9BACT|nr:subclass B1 metallo-beta-lactamase [Neolewinella marina]NJB84502.1 metallo-beta-lactamase class B [Neolewinella marina]PHL00309.1 subclass B1 metallo-beta-lactamase [Neolewinella marina]
MKTSSLLAALGLLLSPCLLVAQAATETVYESPTLRIDRLAAGVYVHVSYLETESFGRVPCNGIVYASDGEAVVVDTPADGPGAEELLAWIDTALLARPTAVVATHFHADCTGGLDAFHARRIPSYAHLRTLELAAARGEAVPRHGFDSLLVLSVGLGTVENRYFGAGHTRDNIVSYLPGTGVLFGGCLIKADGAGKGNLADADPEAWSPTVKAVRTAYPEVEWVIPGHGPVGGAALLDYTVRLFE